MNNIFSSFFPFAEVDPNDSRPYMVRIKEHASKFHVGMLVRIIEVPDQQLEIRKLARVNAVGLIVKLPITKNMTTFNVLINERVYYHVHALDMEPV